MSVDVSATNVYLSTMTNHFDLVIWYIAIIVVLANATDTPPVVSITQRWIRNRLNTTLAAAASVSTVRIIPPEVGARHAWWDTSDLLDVVCRHETCVFLATVASTAFKAPTWLTAIRWVLVAIKPKIVCVSLFLMNGHSFERIWTKFGTWHPYNLRMVKEVVSDRSTRPGNGALR